MPPFFFCASQAKARAMKSASSISIAPEWAPQSSVWVGWPTLEDEWGAAFEPARIEIAAFVQHLSKYIQVHIAAGSDEAARSAEKLCQSHANIHKLPLGDIWLRDTGPLPILTHGKPAALDFGFDGWGGKYVMPGDTETAAAISGKLGLPVHRPGFVLEGGAIDLDGEGRLLTTRQCLLDGIRNPEWDEGAAEKALRAALGVTDIIWLDRGLLNDHTDGHIDNLARFIAPGHVLCQSPSGEDDPNGALFSEVEATLRSAGLRVDTLPSPGRIEISGDIVPASHMNFLITNGTVFLPIFEDEVARVATTRLEALFPKRKIIPLPAKNILAGGGTFHCMTRDIPALAPSETRT